jgi:class 3 adenylate cyclase
VHLLVEKQARELRYFNENLRKAFSTYLSGDVVEELIADPTRLQLGGIKRRMSAVFTDIQNFSSISETLAPDELVYILNRYLTAMSDAILDQKGTIDKYDGDAIMAFFGMPLEFPDHALRSCTSAIIMKRREAELNKKFAETKVNHKPFLTRIGIHAGDMIVSNIRTERKMSYTIIGHAVNMASRLEGINKQYGTWVIASEDTVKECGDRIFTRRLDRIRVVGVNSPVRIYEVLELSDSVTPELRAQTELFHEALSFFEARDWNAALSTFDKTLEGSPDDRPSLLYAERCRQYLQTPPAGDWDGVYNISEK